MEPPLIVLGDIHLDGRRNVFIDFLDLLAQRSPGRLVILGDLFDYWLETDAAVRRGQACFDRLQRLNDLGWQLDLLRGNREMAAGRVLETQSRCQFHWPVLDIPLGGKLIRVVHGDRLCHDLGHAFLDVHMRGFWLRAFRGAAPAVVQEGIARHMRRSSRRKHLKRRRQPGSRVARRIYLDPRRVKIAGRGCDHLIAGHIHECWRRQVGGVDLMLVGDWTATSGSWVMGYADGRLEQVSHQFVDGGDPNWVR